MKAISKGLILWAAALIGCFAGAVLGYNWDISTGQDGAIVGTWIFLAPIGLVIGLLLGFYFTRRSRG